MRASILLLLGAGLLWGATAGAAQMTVCIVDGGIQNNINYLGLATTKTRMLCELDKENYRPTLPELYAEGWRLIQVVGGESAVGRQGQNVKSPVYYLHRDSAPAGTGGESAGKTDRKGKGFTLF